MHHFVAIGKFKLELRTRDAQFGSKAAIILPADLEIWRMTLKSHREPIFTKSSLVQHFVAIGKFKLVLQFGNAQFGSNRRFFIPCELEIWRITLKNNTAPIQYYTELCASFCSHWLIQTGVTVREHPIWVKIGDILSRVTWKFDGWPWKRFQHLFYATSSFVHHFVAISEFELELQSGNG